MPRQTRYLSGNAFLSKDGRHWWLRFRLPDGTDSKKKLGPAHKGRGRPPAGHYTELTAQGELNALLKKWEGFTVGSDPLFKYAADEYLEWCEGPRDLRGTTTKEYRRILDKNLRPVLADLKLSKITEDVVVELRGDLDDLAAGTINQVKIVLAGVIKCARKKRKYRGDDPSEWFERVAMSPKTHIDVYSAAEIELIARTLRSGTHRKTSEELKRPLSRCELDERRRSDDQDAVIVRAAAYAGLRMSEVRALRWRDIDFAGAKITIRKRYADADGEKIPKSKKARTIPMASQLAVELDHLSRRDGWTDTDDLVFCNFEGEVLSASGIYGRYVKAAEKAALRRLRFHDLRHTFGTMAVQKFPLSDVKEMLGHADIKTTLIYVHYIPRQESAQKMTDLISDSMGVDEFSRAVEEVTEDA